MRIRTKIVVAAAASGALALGAPLAAYAGSDGSGALPDNGSGIVSDNGLSNGLSNGSDVLSDIVSNNDVAAPVNVCDVNANVIGGEVNNDAAAKCQNNVDQSGDTSKDGSDDVLSDIVSNNDVAAPVNVCDVNANVIGGEVNNDAAAECQNNVDQGDNGKPPKDGDDGKPPKDGDDGKPPKDGDDGKPPEDGDNGKPEDGDNGIDGAKPAEPIVAEPSFAG